MKFRIAAALAGDVLIFAGLCRAQTPENPDVSSQRELVIGTKQAQPFAMKAADGTWQGISMDLWRRVADQLHLHYRFAEEPDVQELIDGIVAEKFDVAVAALTVTAGREQLLDFTQPSGGQRWQ
jgi:polar amino acid transport system substrate-binding protein